MTRALARDLSSEARSGRFPLNPEYRLASRATTVPRLRSCRSLHLSRSLHTPPPQRTRRNSTSPMRLRRSPLIRTRTSCSKPCWASSRRFPAEAGEGFALPQLLLRFPTGFPARTSFAAPPPPDASLLPASRDIAWLCSLHEAPRLQRPPTSCHALHCRAAASCFSRQASERRFREDMCRWTRHRPGRARRASPLGRAVPASCTDARTEAAGAACGPLGPPVNPPALFGWYSDHPEVRVASRPFCPTSLLFHGTCFGT